MQGGDPEKQQKIDRLGQATLEMDGQGNWPIGEPPSRIEA